MRTPSVRFADDLKGWDVKTEDKSGRWVLARPSNYEGICLLWRLRMAWLVFTGDADVLAWKAGQTKYFR